MDPYATAPSSRCCAVRSGGTEELEGSMNIRKFGTAILVASSLVVVLHLTNPPPAAASIHEIIAALCRAGGEEVVPPGQNRDGNSFLAALQATGFITSIDFSDPTKVVFNFDPT